MDFHNVYIFFKESLCVFPKDLIFVVMELTYEKCNECKKYLVDEEFKCNNCNTYYCKFHYTISIDVWNCINCESVLKNIKKNNRIDNICIICNKPSAYYGYKDVIAYCYDHVKGKTLIYYDKWCINNVCHISGIYYDDQRKTSFCKKHTTSRKLNYQKY